MVWYDTGTDYIYVGVQGATEAADEGVYGGGAAAAHATHHQVSQAHIYPDLRFLCCVPVSFSGA